MTSSAVTQINDDIHFAWQAQYLVRLAGDFSWQAQHFVTFWEIAGTRNVVFYNRKSSPSWDESGLRSGGCEMTILWSDVVGCGRIILELSSNRLSIGGSIQGVSAEIWRFQISWQAHYLLRLQGDFTCSTHWKWRFICDADPGWHSFCVAGAVFGDVGGWLYLLHALEMTFHMWRRSLMTFILRGRRSIWWCWRVTLLAPRIGNDVSYVTQIIDDIHFAWQAQYLVRLAGDFSWQAQHFVTFWEIAGTRNVVFYNRKSSPSWDESGLRSGGCEMTILWSDVVGCGRIILELSSNYPRIVFLLAEAFRELALKSGAFRFRGRRTIWWGCRVTLLAPRIGNDVSYVTQIRDDIHFAWQAQYLVMLEGDFTCSTHWKWRFICDADHWWHSFCVAGAVFGDVGGWLYLLHALEMTFQSRAVGLLRSSTGVLQSRTGVVLCSTEWYWSSTL